jgi:hypothetical protein
MLRGISESKKKEIVGVWRKLHTVEFYNFYSSPNIIMVIRSKKMS